MNRRRRRRYKIKHSYIKKSRGRSRSRQYTKIFKRNKKRKKKRKTPFNRFESKINTFSRETSINFPETYMKPKPMNFPKTLDEGNKYDPQNPTERLEAQRIIRRAERRKRTRLPHPPPKSYPIIKNSSAKLNVSRFRGDRDNENTQKFLIEKFKDDPETLQLKLAEAHDDYRYNPQSRMKQGETRLAERAQKKEDEDGWSDEQPFDDTSQRNQQQFTPWPDISNESQDTLKNVGNVLNERLEDDPTLVKNEAEVDGWASDWSD